MNRRMSAPGSTCRRSSFGGTLYTAKLYDSQICVGSHWGGVGPLRAAGRVFAVFVPPHPQPALEDDEA
jgi:hypothetical protein